MTDGLRVGLLLFALLSALAAVPLLWHHLRPRALLWLHATGIGIGLQTAEWGTPPAETGHSLTAIYLILLTLMTISGQSPRWPERTLRRVGVASG